MATLDWSAATAMVNDLKALKTANVEARLTALEGINAPEAGRITALETAVAEKEARIAALEANVAALQVQLSAYTAAEAPPAEAPPA